jgi:hypothetical protein
MARQYRQGDVLLVRLDRTLGPDSALTPVPRTDGRRVLASGEATGHAHAIESDLAELLQDRNGRLYLRLRGGCELTHEEHSPIRLEVGVYRVVRQREYRGDMVRD